MPAVLSSMQAAAAAGAESGWAAPHGDPARPPARAHGLKITFWKSRQVLGPGYRHCGR